MGLIVKMDIRIHNFYKYMVVWTRRLETFSTTADYFLLPYELWQIVFLAPLL
jgi:hypothetical protein